MKITIISKPYIVHVNETFDVNTVSENLIEYNYSYSLLAAKCLAYHWMDAEEIGIILFDSEQATYWHNEDDMNSLFTMLGQAPDNLVCLTVKEYNKSNPLNKIIYK